MAAMAAWLQVYLISLVECAEQARTQRGRGEGGETGSLPPKGSMGKTRAIGQYIRPP